LNDRFSLLLAHLKESLTYNEPELLRQLADGSESAFRVLFDNYWDRIYSTAYAFTKSTEQSLDLGQEVFARIWISREKLRAVKNFEAYLHIVARNATLDTLRQKTYIPANDQFFENYFSAGEETPEDKFDLKELKELVEQGISKLPAQQERAFRLSRFQGLSIEQIANEMGVSAATAKSHLVRATARLRKYLDEHRDLGIIIWMLLFL